MFETDGELVSKGKCDYKFESGGTPHVNHETTHEVTHDSEEEDEVGVRRTGLIGSPSPSHRNQSRILNSSNKYKDPSSDSRSEGASHAKHPDHESDMNGFYPSVTVHKPAISGLTPGANSGSFVSPFVTTSTSGRFYSPQYPSTYPKNTECSYLFVGKPHERVKLIFEHIRLQKGDLR